MNRSPRMKIVARAGAAFLATAALVCAFPAPLMRLISPGVRALTALTFPQVERLSLLTDDARISIEGTLRLNLVRDDGQSIPPVPGKWQKSAGPTLYLLVVTMAAFAAPAMSARRRVAAAPWALVFAWGVCSFHLAVEIQEVALRFIGYEWLPALSFAATDENVARFHALERRYTAISWVKSFNDAGGVYFLAFIAGWAGSVVGEACTGRLSAWRAEKHRMVHDARGT
jgi:hypothetical protein